MGKFRDIKKVCTISSRLLGRKSNIILSILDYLVQQILSKSSSMDILSHSSAWGALQGASLGIWNTGGGRARNKHLAKRRHKEWREKRAILALPPCPSRPLSSTGCWSPVWRWGSTWQGRNLWTGKTFPVGYKSSSSSRNSYNHQLPT